MPKINFITVLFLLSFCGLIAQDAQLLQWATQGAVSNEEYYEEIPFRYIDGYIFIDIVQHNKPYNFLFDTGAEATLIDRSIIDEFDYKQLGVSNISGPIIKNQGINTIVLDSIHIATLNFVNIGAVAIDLTPLKKKFCNNVYGVIGSTLLKKSNWQIDYANRIIRIATTISRFKISDTATKLPTFLPSKGWGTEAVEVSIDGIATKFEIDTGNGRSKIVAHPSQFKRLLKINKKSTVPYGFAKAPTDYRILTKKIEMGNLELLGQELDLLNDVGQHQLLGNRFFENFLVTLDWKNHFLYLEEKRAIAPNELIDFELRFAPDFQNHNITVLNGVKAFVKKNKIEKGAVLIKVNDTDLSGFSDEEFCRFWNESWQEVLKGHSMDIILTQHSKKKILTLTKKQLVAK